MRLTPDMRRIKAYPRDQAVDVLRYISTEPFPMDFLAPGESLARPKYGPSNEVVITQTSTDSMIERRVASGNWIVRHPDGSLSVETDFSVLVKKYEEAS